MGGQEEGIPAPPSYSWPPFTNWDCIGVRGLLDWDELYHSVVRSGLQADAAARGSLRWNMPEWVMSTLQGHSEELMNECALGTLYFMVLYTLRVLVVGTKAADTVLQANSLKRALRFFPFFVIAGARWPTFEALHFFAVDFSPQNAKAARTTLCDGVRGDSGIDWDALLASSLAWSTDQLAGHEPGASQGLEHTQAIRDAAGAIYTDPLHRGLAAQDECPFGFMFLCTTQVLAAVAGRTDGLETWTRTLDRMLADLPFFGIAASGWPIYQLLAMFASLSKGDDAVPVLGGFQADVHRFGGQHPAAKRFRQYGDLRLHTDELCPLGRNQQGWMSVDALVSLPASEWYDAVASRLFKDIRPVMAEAMGAAMDAVRASTHPSRWECGFSGMTEAACLARNCIWRQAPPPGDSSPPDGAEWPRCQRPSPSRKVVAVTFMWGERWAPLVPQYAAWAVRLGLSTVMVTMGEECRQACKAAASALGGSSFSGIACWDPRVLRGSIIQRHTMVHLLLHLGVDVVAFDFDTFLFRDPRLPLEAKAREAGGADILMTRHLDADCLNMGLLYLRASARTAEWYSRYLEWLHQHLYEREQRGMNALLGFTEQKVSFPPLGMPVVKAAALDDYNEFVSSRGGWLGDWQRLHFFHWVNPAETLVQWGDVKLADLKELYRAALDPSVPNLGGAGSLAPLLAAATPDSPLWPARVTLSSMIQAEPPERQQCW